MRWPFQHINSLEGSSQQSQGLLIAASGAQLTIVKVDDGTTIAEWTAAIEEAEIETEQPAKRQKLENGSATTSNIILLATAPSSDHFVVVTDDKWIVVLSLDDQQKVHESSRRPMPKRPCAIEILPEEQLILCGDKFGDVYSLPLLVDPDTDASFVQANSADQAQQPKMFKTSASELTVHTKRNLRALESQQKQKHFTPKKSALMFEHKLLLGHVSMLTDLAYVKDHAQRGRIITADRDEHIRVSRGPSQAYVIEGFCLGHTEFLSKICPIATTTLLASGGGDDWIGIWDWTTYEMKHKIDIKQALDQAGLRSPDQLGRVALAGLINVRVSGTEDSAELVAWYEGVQAMVLLSVQTASTATTAPHISIQALDSTPIAATQVQDNLIISLDARNDTQARLRAFTITKNAGFQLQQDDSTQSVLGALNQQTTAECDAAILDKFLYTTAALRKRRAWEEPHADEED